MPNNLQQRFAGADPKFFSIAKVGGINTQAPRESIKDEQFSWLENMQPIGDGNWRTLNAEAAPILTAGGGKTIVYFFMAVMNGSRRGLVFYEDGTADDVDTQSPHTVTTITATPGTFYAGNPNPLPMVAQFSRVGVVIVTTAVADGYFAWDGTTLTSPGGAAPDWLTDTTPTTMPTGINGTCVGIYAGRVWIGNLNVLTFSAPGNGADFTTMDGAGAVPFNNEFLRNEITNIIENNGFLYIFADSSINVISNVQTVGTGPAITTFNNQNVDPQTGTPWHNAVGEFGSDILFSNEQGVYSLSGGTATKISDDLDGIFLAAQAGGIGSTPILQPTSATAFVNNIRCYMILLPAEGPFDSVPRNVVAIFDGKKWFIGSQVRVLTFIATFQYHSELIAYGTNGTQLFQMFSVPSESLKKIWQTRLWPGSGMQITKQALRFYSQLDDRSGSGHSVTGTIDYILEGTGLLTQAVSTITGASAVQTLSGMGSISSNIRGNFIGLTMQSTSPYFVLVNQTLLYREESPLGG